MTDSPSPILLDDEEFLQKFEDCSLSRECWTHTAHIRMAWLQMERAASFYEALERIRVGIVSFNASVNNAGYHETITVAFARLIYLRRQSDVEARNWQDFLIRHSDLVSRDNPILRTYYSAEVLHSNYARANFVEPDLRPLPCPSAGKEFVTEDG